MRQDSKRRFLQAAVSAARSAGETACLSRSARKALVIGIDASTTSCKAIAWDRAGQAVAEGRASYSLLQPKPNWYEQDAETWWHATCTALRTLLGQIDAAQVDALCITHQRESFVPVDDQGCPLRNGILWLDERSRAQVGFLQRCIGRERFHQTTGKPLTTNPSVTKIVWLAQHEPEIVARAHKFLDVHAFLVYRLTGAFRTSLASADPMGLVDMQSDAWADDMIAEVGLRPDQLPELIMPGRVIGSVSAEAAAATGLPAGLKVVAGAGDGQCASLGANAIGSEGASLNLGTAVVSGVVSADYLAEPAFRTLYAPIAGKYLLETVIQGGAFTVNWFVAKFGGDLRDSDVDAPQDMLEAAATEVPPGSLGLVVVPYWNHAMTPYWDTAASGITIGWTGTHGREHLYRAILEGIAFEQRLLGEGLAAATGQPIEEYVALGGGSRSDLWCQIVADVTGVDVVRATTSEATCLGAGILAAHAARWYPDLTAAADAMTDTAERFAPDPGTHAIYDRLYASVYRPLFPTLQPLLHRLTELTDETG
jgi:sugar (pentulose or hexulose) kinase